MEAACQMIQALGWRPAGDRDELVRVVVGEIAAEGPIGTAYAITTIEFKPRRAGKAGKGGVA